MGDDLSIGRQDPSIPTPPPTSNNRTELSAEDMLTALNSDRFNDVVATFINGPASSSVPPNITVTFNQIKTNLERLTNEQPDSALIDPLNKTNEILDNGLKNITSKDFEDLKSSLENAINQQASSSNEKQVLPSRDQLVSPTSGKPEITSMLAPGSTTILRSGFEHILIQPGTHLTPDDMRKIMIAGERDLDPAHGGRFYSEIEFEPDTFNDNEGLDDEGTIEKQK